MRDVTKFANEVSFIGDAIAVPVSYVVLKILIAHNKRVSEKILVESLRLNPVIQTWLVKLVIVVH